MDLNDTPSLRARFWAKVDTSGGCWLWTAGLDHYGYGSFSVKCKSAKAHRVAYILTYGPIAAGIFVCHHCDNPKCVRPDHLFLGTNIDNVQDRDRKGRTPKGEAASNVKITEGDVRVIRSLAGTGKTHTEIASLYGLSRSTIGRIVSREWWKHVE